MKVVVHYIWVIRQKRRFSFLHLELACTYILTDNTIGLYIDVNIKKRENKKERGREGEKEIGKGRCKVR